MSRLSHLLAVVRGGGDLGTGVALRLQRAGVRVLVLETPQPTVIRRAVAFASAVYDGAVEVEGVSARVIDADAPPERLWASGEVPVIVDPDASILSRHTVDALVDAIVAKRNTGTRIGDAPIVVALGPGFTAGVDCHAVVETSRGHNLGRVYYAGSAAPNTGLPGNLGGHDALRVVRAPATGVFEALGAIGDRVRVGEAVGRVGESPAVARLDGVLRGVLHGGLRVPIGMKIADVDPRGVAHNCFTVSDKSWAVGGGVLEAVLHLWSPRE